MSESNQEGKPRRLLLGVGLVFFILWLGCRSMPMLPYLHPDDSEPRLAGSDPYYHLRHARAILEHFPIYERYDEMSAFPKTERGMNQGFFDLGVATLSKVTGGLISPLQTLTWISPVLAGLALLLIFGWLCRVQSRECGSVFLLLSLAYPASLLSTASAGFGDHHMAELFLALLLVFALDWLLKPETSWKWAPLATVPLYLIFMTWAGAPIHLLLVGCAFYVRLWTDAGTDQARSTALKATLFGASLGVMVEISTLVYSNSILWYSGLIAFRYGYGALTVGAFPLMLLARKTPPKPRPLVALLLLVVPALVLNHPLFQQSLKHMSDDRTRFIAEHVEVTPTLIWFWWGPLILTVLAAPLVLGLRKRLKAVSVPLVYGGGLLLLWALTYDFAYYVPPIVCACAAYLLCVRKGHPKPLAVGVLLVLPLLPLGLQPPLMRPEMAQEAMVVTDGLAEASEWLRGQARKQDKATYGLMAPWDLGNILACTAETPVGWSQTSWPDLAQKFFSTDPDAVYHDLVSQSKKFRYVLIPAGNLNQKLAAEMTLAGLPTDLMIEKGAVVQVGEQKVPLYQTTQRTNLSLMFQLFRNRASNLGHYRLVYESQQKVVEALRVNRTLSQVQFVALPASEQELEALKPLLNATGEIFETSRGLLANLSASPAVRVFELVPGAVLEGKAPAKTYIGAELDLYSPTTAENWTGTWGTWTDESGKFSLRLPYPTDGPLSEEKGTVVVKGSYRVLISGQPHPLEVSEQQIQSEAYLTL